MSQTPESCRPQSFSRRAVLAGGAAGLALAGLPTSAGAASLIRSRGTLPSGIQIGDVTTNSAVLWARSDRPGRMVARISDGTRHGAREIVGPWATATTETSSDPTCGAGGTGQTLGTIKSRMYASALAALRAAEL